jgi:hypothetical protein
MKFIDLVLADPFLVFSTSSIMGNEVGVDGEDPKIVS